jgi:hypothetical protein
MSARRFIGCGAGGGSTGGQLWARWAYRLDRRLCPGFSWVYGQFWLRHRRRLSRRHRRRSHLSYPTGSPQLILPNFEVLVVIANLFLVC